MASETQQLKTVSVENGSKGVVAAAAAPAIGIKAALGKPVPSTTKRWHAAALGLIALLVGVAIAAAVTIPVAHHVWKKDNGNGSKNRGASLTSSSDTSSTSSPVASGQIREYYIAAERIQWNYTPLGRNNCTGKAFTENEAPGPNNTYWKAVFRQYTDGTFKVLKARPAEEEHLGYVGPVLRAEVGDTVQVVLRNLLPFPINIEPSGVSYTPPTVANPGDTVINVWKTTEESVVSGTSSQMWVYRSTFDPITHTNAGLVGPLVVTKQGEAQSDGKPKDADREIFTFMHVVEEDAVPEGLQEEGIEFVEDSGDEAGRKLMQAAKEEGAVKQMPKVHAINGFMFCNQPGMDIKKGENVRWYVGGLGNEADAHVAHWHGITLVGNNHRLDSSKLLPGTTATLDTTADNPGTWLFHCHINSHMASGMMSFFHISGDAVDTAAAVEGKTRQYYIAAEVEEWDYAPEGGDLCHGGKTPEKFQDLTFVGSGPGRIGRKYQKARFVEYTDATFKTKKARTADEEHLGLLGPIIRAEVGDKITVLFQNNVPGHSFSIHPHGVLYDKAGEGAPYNDGTAAALKADDGVATGKQHTYTWLVPERAGPADDDKSSVFWMYHSHVDETMDTYAGLFGGIIVTKNMAAQENGMPKDVDREIVMLFYVTDEQKSALYPENVEKYLKISGTPGKGGLVKEARDVLAADGLDAMKETVLQRIYAKDLVNGTVPEDLVGGYGEHNLKHNINGYMYCNLPGLTASVSQRVRIYAMTLGDMEDVHSPALYGSRFIVDGEAQQAVQQLAGMMLTADALPSAPGNFMFQCMVNDHVMAGMRALLRVNGSAETLQAQATGETRRYFIASEQVDWDYAPLGYDGCSGQKFGAEQQVFTMTTADTLGSKYRKARYVQYNDSTFTTKVPQPGPLGLLGPLLIANVGDKIEIVFKNKLKNTKASLKFAGGLLPLTMETLTAGQKLPDLPAAPATVVKAPAEYDGRRLLAANATTTTTTTKAATNTTTKAATPTTTTKAAATPAAPAAAPASSFTGVDDITAALQEGINPGGMALTTWVVPSNAGPGPSDDAGVVAYTYLSAVDEIAHIYAGMVGFIAVGNQGTFDASGEAIGSGAEENVAVTSAVTSTAASSTASAPAAPKPYDGRRRLHSSDTVAAAKFITPLLFMYFDENQSPYLDENLKLQAAAAKLPKPINTSADAFYESNLMHGVNGRVYCNLPALKLKRGQTGIVILAAMGSEEMHTPVFEGVDVHLGNRNVMATALLPSVTQVVTITGREPGNWKVYCQVTDHYGAGMMTRMVVAEPATVGNSGGSGSSSGAASPPYDGRRLRRFL